MKHFIVIYFLLSISSYSFAHPGIGIVKDSKGNIYYTDLGRVWKITPAGNKTAVVKNVHTHELYMDANDDLYGEHLWYNGEGSDTWHHYAWCFRHTGKLDTIIKPTEGFLTDYSFVRDAADNMYWVQRFTVSRFKKRSASGQVTTIAEGKFKNIRYVYATKNGIIYFIDEADLYKLENGKFTLLAKDLQKSTPATDAGTIDHNVYGIWTDKSENIYTALLGGQVVKKITPAGKISDVVYSKDNWKPNSGVFDDAGNLWLMESNITNEVRVRKIAPKDLSETASAVSYTVKRVSPLIIMITLFIVIVFSLFRLRWLKNKTTASLI